MPQRELTPGRYAIDRDGRLYSCRGQWRRNAVAIVTIKRRADRPSEPERKKIAAIEAQLEPPVLVAVATPGGHMTDFPADSATTAAFESVVAAARRSMARFKPMGVRSEDEDAAAAYARAVEAEIARD